MGVSQHHMIENLLEYVPMLLDWVGQFMSHTPMPGKGEIEFRRSVRSCDLESDHVIFNTVINVLVSN